MIVIALETSFIIFIFHIFIFVTKTSLGGKVRCCRSSLRAGGEAAREHVHELGQPDRGAGPGHRGRAHRLPVPQPHQASAGSPNICTNCTSALALLKIFIPNTKLYYFQFVHIRIIELLYIDVKTEDLPTRRTRSSSRSGPRAGSCERRYSETPAHDSCSGSGRTADTASQEQCARKARTRAFVNGECAGSGAAGHLAAGGLIKVITCGDN